MLGVPRSTVSRALGSGLVVAEKDGLIDPKRSCNANYQHDTEIRKAEGRALSYTRPSGKNHQQLDERIKNFPPTSLRELKTYAEVQKISVDVMARTGELIERHIVTRRMQELGQNIQMFVDLDARVAGRICQKLDRVGMEKEVQKIIAPEVTKTIQEFKESCMHKN